MLPSVLEGPVLKVKDCTQELRREFGGSFACDLVSTALFSPLSRPAASRVPRTITVNSH